MTKKDLNAKSEWNDGRLADNPAEHDPTSHITAGIQESYGLNPHITDNPEEMKEGRSDPFNRIQKPLP
ncbi:hypothetical protein ACFO25_13245 [Paenactinomyces guangxiensis]|uniref:Uncharacterized protein n=1 Tax=Paenactinomyces guangxiensis TaxID=1490290 RepID=A0A7W2A7R8_9BACL|nr:hypothetical protein [Paenactinomyces guangxiensis]MBA4493414.1 hypothetical protein [Paenactinomyces guangxiensis]MBH8590505.1 hypothetical protein [Paenactinomyces guangxiensis]